MLECKFDWQIVCFAFSSHPRSRQCRRYVTPPVSLLLPPFTNKTLRYLSSFTCAVVPSQLRGQSSLVWLRTKASYLEVLILIQDASHSAANHHSNSVQERQQDHVLYGDSLHQWFHALQRNAHVWLARILNHSYRMQQVILGTAIHVSAAHHFPFLPGMSHICVCACVVSPVTAATAIHFMPPFWWDPDGNFSRLPTLLTIIVTEMFLKHFRLFVPKDSFIPGRDIFKVSHFCNLYTLMIPVKKVILYMLYFIIMLKL